LKGIRDTEVPAGFPGEEIGDFSVSGNGLDNPGLRITPQRVGTTFALEVAPVPPEVPEQRGALHLIETVVRSAS